MKLFVFALSTFMGTFPSVYDLELDEEMKVHTIRHHESIVLDIPQCVATAFDESFECSFDEIGNKTYCISDADDAIYAFDWLGSEAALYYLHGNMQTPLAIVKARTRNSATITWLQEGTPRDVCNIVGGVVYVRGPK